MTLLELMAGHRFPSGGTTEVGDLCSALRWTAASSGVGFVAQQPHLFEGTVRENLAQASSGAQEEQMWRALEFVELADTHGLAGAGLETPLGRHGERLSAGERRRLCLAPRCCRHRACCSLTSQPRVSTQLPPAG